MQSQRKMLSSGIAARTRSANVRSAATEDAVARDIPGLFDAGAQDDARIEVGLAADEPARHLRERAGIDHEPQPLTRSIGNGDEDRVRLDPAQNRFDLGRAAEHRNSLQTAARQTRIVVHESDDLPTRSLAQLPQQAASPAPGADYQRALPVAAACQR